MNMDKEIKDLKENDHMQSQSIKSLQNTLKSQQNTLKSLQNTLKWFTDREKKVTLREIARKLERHICFELAGCSKSKAKAERFAFHKFDQPGQQTQVEQKLQSLGLTRDLIKSLKDTEDDVAHVDCYPMNKEDVLEMLDRYGEDAKRQKENFVAALDCYKLIKADGSVDFSKDAF